MSYQAFYRKFRPDSFKDVKGQDHIVKTLMNQIKADRVGHAYLFCGTRGTGKTTVAKVFAKAVNCLDPTEDGPCNQCELCQAINQQTSMNVVEIDAASNNKVEDIRQVIDEVQYSPSQGKYKVYIIDEVHMLSTSAFNALLKTLEEPPSYLIFILATTEVHKIPTTILSRCQRYDFRRISVDTITERLQELMDAEGIVAEDKALRYIARSADGALRDGLSLLEQCVSYYYGEELTYEKVLKALGAVDQRVYTQLMKELVNRSVNGVIGLLDQVVSEGKDLSQFTMEFVWFLRNMLLIKTSEDVAELVDMSEENLEELRGVSKHFDDNCILRYIRIFSELGNQLRYATNKRVLLEVALIKLCCPEMEKDYDSLKDRIKKLEDRLEKGQFAAPTVESKQKPAQAQPVVEKKKLLPEAVPEELQEVAKRWTDIVRELEPVDQSFLQNVRLTVGNDNHLLLVFDSELPASYFKDDEDHYVALTNRVNDFIGKNVKLDIRVAGSQQEHESIPELRDMFQINDKVNIEFID